MNCESTNEAIFKSLIVIHFDEFIEVDAVKVKYAAEMISEDEIISEFYNSLYIIRVTLLE